MLKFVKVALVLIAGPLLAVAQDFPLNPLSTSDWKTSQGKWNSAASISINPFENKIISQAGNEVLFASTPSEMVTVRNFSDLKFSFEFLQSNETEASLILANGFEISLNNSFGGKKPFVGSVSGSSQAGQNVCKATGLWNKVELTFIQGKEGNPAILEKLTINGIVLHRSVLKWGLSTDLSPLKFVVKKGLLAVRNAAASAYEDRRPVSVSNITYKLQETESWQADFAFKSTPPITGESDVLTARIENDYRHFDLVSKGDLEVEESGNYAFTLDYQGVAQLKIDGKEVVGSKEIIFRTPITGMIELAKGKHSFEYHYKRIWWPAGLGLFVSGPDFRAYKLHDAASLPDPKVTGGIFVEPSGQKAQLVRSFMQFGKDKRTQVISIGTPQNRHFSFDLGTGSLLYAWKGNFADVTEMWYERGEPQIIKPLGQTITFSGNPSFQVAGNTGELKLQEYYLDQNGIPTFNFLLNGSLVSQKFIPEPKGMKVEVSSEKPGVQYLIAAGADLQMVGKGLFKTADYFIKIPDNVKVTKKEESGNVEFWSTANDIQSFEIIW